MEKIISYKWPFNKVSYINNDIYTSFEKNVNKEIDEDKLNNFTGLNNKPLTPDEGENKVFYADFAQFIINRLHLLEASDKQLIIQKQNEDGLKRNSYYVAAYKTYKDIVENYYYKSVMWDNWNEANSSFYKFKNLSSDSIFYKNTQKNLEYKFNLMAKEQTDYLFNRI